MKESKKELIHLRLSQELHDLIYRAAFADDRTVSDFIRRTMRIASEKILKDGKNETVKIDN